MGRSEWFSLYWNKCKNRGECRRGKTFFFFTSSVSNSISSTLLHLTSRLLLPLQRQSTPPVSWTNLNVPHPTLGLLEVALASHWLAQAQAVRLDKQLVVADLHHSNSPPHSIFAQPMPVSATPACLGSLRIFLVYRLPESLSSDVSLLSVIMLVCFSACVYEITNQKIYPCFHTSTYL